MKKLSLLFVDVLLKIVPIRPLLKLLKKYKLFLIAFLIVLSFMFALWLNSLNMAQIVSYKSSLLLLVAKYPLLASLLFFMVYLLFSTISLPGLTVFNIVGGFLFGFVKGTVLSVFAVSIGSSFCFLLIRFFFSGFFIKKGGKKLKKIHQHLNKNQVYYLFAFRLFPFTPLFFTNLIMGLSSIRLSLFYTVSFIALLPQLAIYANIGAQMSQLENLQGLVQPNLLFAFSLIALFPFTVKFLFYVLKKIKPSAQDLPLEADKAYLSSK